MSTYRTPEQRTPESAAIDRAMEQRDGRKKRSTGGSFTIIVLIVALAVLGYGYYKKSKEVARLADPAVVAEEVRKNTEKILEDVEKYMILPSEEQPLLVPIENGDVLKQEQPFYRNVETGDMILVFQSVGQVVIWSPGRQRIVNVGPIINNNSGQQTQSQVRQQPTETPAADTPAEDDK